MNSERLPFQNKKKHKMFTNFDLINTSVKMNQEKHSEHFKDMRTWELLKCKEVYCSIFYFNT